MVKTNILVEVSDEVNELVVVPHKRNYTFSKLMATLLQGYIEDSYIRAYAEGNLTDIKKASVDALDSTLNDMRSSLSSLGIYTNELKSSTEGGLRHFNSYQENAFAEEKKEEVKETKVENSESSEDVREAVNELKEQNKMMMDMLQKLLSEGIPRAIGKEEVAETHKVEPEVVVTKPIPTEIVEDDNEERESEFLKPGTLKEITDEEVTEESDEEDEDIDVANLMSSFLAGNVFSV